MIESMLIPFVKSLPVWLSQVVEVLIVAVIFSFATIFLWGLWCGIRIVGKRSNQISEITIFPPTIKFREKSSE